MKFTDIIEQSRALLQRTGRITYRVLKREFALDDDALELRLCGAPYLDGVDEALSKNLECGSRLPFLYPHLPFCQLGAEGSFYLSRHTRIPLACGPLDVLIVPVKVKPINLPSFEGCHFYLLLCIAAFLAFDFALVLEFRERDR